MTHYLPLNRFTLMLGHFTNGQALPILLQPGSRTGKTITHENLQGPVS